MRKITIVIICLMLITTFSCIFPMKITVAEPPYKPSSPNPDNNSSDVSIFTNLSWSGDDPDGDPVTYDVYFGNESPPGFKSTVAISKFTLGSLLYNTRYYWKIVANDSNSSTPGDIWTFTTEEQTNLPPNTPNNPNPEDDSSGISIDADLSWSCSDPENDTLTYDIFFGVGNPPPNIANDVLITSYTLDALNYGITYYWRIIANDSYNETTGPVWSFLTNRAPFEPDNPNPINGLNNVSINVDLSWTCDDPDQGDVITYDVYFGDSNPPPNVGNDSPYTTYNPGTLNYTTTYFWKIIAWDDQGASTIGPLWSFTTGMKVNHPPNIPNNPSPVNGYLGASIDVDLSWSGEDPDGDPVNYTVYFDTSNPPSKVVDNQSATSYSPISLLAYETVYYWKIVAWDNSSATSTGPIWNFTTRSEFNRPPNIPTSETPRNSSTNVKVNSDISWVGGDPDPGDTVTYDVYFGTSNPPPKKVENQPATYYDPGTLAYTTTYYWRIVAWDTSNNSSTSPLFNFKTGVQTGGDEEPPVPPQNIPPVADLSAGAPYQGYIYSIIRFDASESHDPDDENKQNLSFTWNFGDNSSDDGEIVNHAYIKAGNYTVTLVVTDSKSSTSSATTMCVIRALNQPPTRPTISGETNGKKNTPYTYTAVAIDPNNDHLLYIFQWGNSITETRSNIPNGNTCFMNHSWTAAGRYELTVIVNDSRAENSSKMTVYIDAIQTRGAGYLLDNDGDGTYDAFYSDETHQTSLVHWNGESYLIDKNGDGAWEYVYNATFGLTSYQEPRRTPGFELVLFLGAMTGILVFWRKKQRR